MYDIGISQLPHLRCAASFSAEEELRCPDVSCRCFLARPARIPIPMLSFVAAPAERFQIVQIFCPALAAMSLVMRVHRLFRDLPIAAHSLAVASTSFPNFMPAHAHVLARKKFAPIA